MLYSKGTSILTFNGWLPLIPGPTTLGSGDFILKDLIAIDDGKKQIFKTEVDIEIKKKLSPGSLYIHNEYIETTIDRESWKEAKCILLAIDRVKTFPEYHSWTFDEIYILGMILTDAFYNQSGGIEIYQSAKKKRIVERIDNVLTEIGYKGSLSQRDRGGKHYTWRISKESADHFKNKFDLQDRSNPSFELIFMELNKRRHLLNAMMDGDGTWNNPQHDYGVFYKPQIIDFFQVLAMSLGYKSKINTHRKQIYITRSGYGGFFNTTEPKIDIRDHRTEFIELKENSNKLIYPIMKDNGKIFIGGLM